MHGDKTVFDQNVLFHKSFGFAKQGEPIIYNNELMKIALAVSCGSFELEYSLGFGADWRVRFTKA
jgi:S-adenosylmethionine hydrolase